MNEFNPSFGSESHDFTVHASGLGNFHSVNASAILDMKQRHTLQVVATITSSISLAAAICAMYWFVIMRRNFRRDLVLMLIAGGFWKSLWFVVHSLVTFTKGQVRTDTAFCQASGYLLQVGFEACDVAVLFMSMHMYYQIFPPSRSKLGHDGLYRVRHWVLGAFVLFPNVSASLAFVNPRMAYMSQGAFCSMPLRPYWYRLGLFWIPRYLIWFYIVFVAIRIYRHVGSEFKIFGQEKASNGSLDMPGESSIDRAAKADRERAQTRRDSKQSSAFGCHEQRDSIDEKIAPDDASGGQVYAPIPPSQIDSSISLPVDTVRRHSTPNWAAGLRDFGFDTSSARIESKSTPTSRRGSQQIAPIHAFAAPEIPYIDPNKGSLASSSTRKSSITPSNGPALPRIDEGDGSPPEPLRPQNQANLAVLQRRRAIQRQLRLLFIYPVVYVMLWVVPLVVNVMNYTDYYAQHPIFALQIVQVFMLTAMTHVDVVVFCWRERPWRHIPGSDGTVLGSFMWWRYCFNDTWIQDRKASRALSNTLADETNAEEQKLQPSPRFWASLHPSLFRKSSSPINSHDSSTASAPLAFTAPAKRNFSGGSDRKVLEAERAQERLAMERADYEMNRQSLQDARASVINSQSPRTSERKEWFDKALEDDLSIDHDQRAGEKHEEV